MWVTSSWTRRRTCHQCSERAVVDGARPDRQPCLATWPRARRVGDAELGRLLARASRMPSGGPRPRLPRSVVRLEFATRLLPARSGAPSVGRIPGLEVARGTSRTRWCAPASAAARGVRRSDRRRRRCRGQSPPRRSRMPAWSEDMAGRRVTLVPATLAKAGVRLGRRTPVRTAARSAAHRRLLGLADSRPARPLHCRSEDTLLADLQVGPRVRIAHAASHG